MLFVQVLLLFLVLLVFVLTDGKIIAPLSVDGELAKSIWVWIPLERVLISVFIEANGYLAEKLDEILILHPKDTIIFIFVENVKS